MPARHGAQKFIGRNRPPRIQIECDEEVYGARIKVKLPFVVGVMADLSGTWEEFDKVPDEHRTTRGELEERKFLEIDMDNFEERMKAMKPTAQFTVKNTITGEGNLSVDLTFEKMEDFEPDKIAQRLEPLKKLYETRNALNYLKNQAGNKGKLEKLLQKLIEDPELLKGMVAASKLETTPNN